MSTVLTAKPPSSVMQASLEEYADWQSRRRLSRRTYSVVPASIKEKLQRIENVGAVLWDVYGTLMAVSVGDIESGLEKQTMMIEAFRRTACEFGLMEFLGKQPEERLTEMYVREIEKSHCRKHGRGVFSPEVQIEHIWMRILRKLESAGYRPPTGGVAIDLDLAFKVAYFFDDVSHTKRLYSGALKALEDIKKLGLRQGIISNAQFCTPIVLGILLRRAGRKPTSHTRESARLVCELFDSRFIFFSYRLGVSKPNLHAFDLARERLRRMGIEPARVVYVGNDVLNDMISARKTGFKCVLYAGDKESLTLREDRPECARFEPDAIITYLPQLLKIIG